MENLLRNWAVFITNLFRNTSVFLWSRAGTCRYGEQFLISGFPDRGTDDKYTAFLVAYLAVVHSSPNDRETMLIHLRLRLVSIGVSYDVTTKYHDVIYIGKR